MQKGFAVIILVPAILLVIAAFGGVYYFAFNAGKSKVIEQSNRQIQERIQEERQKLVINRFTGQQSTAGEEAEDTRRDSDLRQYQTGLELYKSDNGKYPDELQDLIDEGIMRLLTEDPVTKLPYSYQPSDDRQSYVLTATLSNEQPYQLKNPQ